MELARLVGQLRFPTANLFYEDCCQQVGVYLSKKNRLLTRKAHSGANLIKVQPGSNIVGTP